MAQSPPPTSITCADLGYVVPGPLLLQDTHLIELFGAFDRERIPERVVHARGGESCRISHRCALADCL